jgi:hypothetical protein
MIMQVGKESKLIEICDLRKLQQNFLKGDIGSSDILLIDAVISDYIKTKKELMEPYDLAPCPFCGRAGECVVKHLGVDYSKIQFGCEKCNIMFDTVDEWENRNNNLSG